MELQLQLVKLLDEGQHLTNLYIPRGHSGTLHLRMFSKQLLKIYKKYVYLSQALENALTASSPLEPTKETSRLPQGSPGDTCVHRHALHARESVLLAGQPGGLCVCWPHILLCGRAKLLFSLFAVGTVILLDALCLGCRNA